MLFFLFNLRLKAKGPRMSGLGTHHAFGQLRFRSEGLLKVHIFSNCKRGLKSIVAMECIYMSIPAEPILPIAYTEPY